MNLFATASKRKPLEKPLVKDEPNDFQQFQHLYKGRCRTGRIFYRADRTPYRKPKAEDSAA